MDTTVSPPTPSGIRCYFIRPHNGDVVRGPIDVKMGADNFTIIGTNYHSQAGFGHFDLIDGPCALPGSNIFARKGVYDFGDGGTEAMISLPVGKHHLCLQLSDGLDVALHYTDEIDIQVVP